MRNLSSFLIRLLTFFIIYVITSVKPALEDFFVYHFLL